jgi:hypothetical protein
MQRPTDQKVGGSNPSESAKWPRPLRPDQRYQSLVVSYWFVRFYDDY